MTVNHRVVGSSPTRGANFPKCCQLAIPCAAVGSAETRHLFASAQAEFGLSRFAHLRRPPPIGPLSDPRGVRPAIPPGMPNPVSSGWRVQRTGPSAHRMTTTADVAGGGFGGGIEGGGLAGVVDS